VLGVFEDVAQADFHKGLVEAAARRLSVEVAIASRRTAGCNFRHLATHLREAERFDRVIVGVDGKRSARGRKVEALRSGLRGTGAQEPRQPTLWSVATPSIEEWMMADEAALPDTLVKELGVPRRRSPRPGRAATEVTAKARLREWVTALVGYPLLNSGLEYAEAVGARTRPSSIGNTRNADIWQLLNVELPAFLAP